MKNVLFFVGILLVFSLLTAGAVTLSQAQTVPFTSSIPSSTTTTAESNLQFPEVFISWSIVGAADHLDKPIPLRATKIGDDVSGLTDFKLPRITNNNNPPYPRIPQDQLFFITTTLLEDQANKLTIGKVFLTPVNSKNLLADRIVLDYDSLGRYSLSRVKVGQYIVDVNINLKGTHVVGDYATRLQVLPAGSVQSINTEGDSVPSTTAEKTKVITKTKVIVIDSDPSKKNEGPKGEPSKTAGPDDDCLFMPGLPKCKPPPGKTCPKGFAMNEDGNCYPDKPCPPGFKRVDDDETGACLKDYGDGCPPGSANPQEGCTLEGFQCGPEGCGYYSHGICEKCITPAITTATVPIVGDNITGDRNLVQTIQQQNITDKVQSLIFQSLGVKVPTVSQ